VITKNDDGPSSDESTNSDGGLKIDTVPPLSPARSLGRNSQLSPTRTGRLSSPGSARDSFSDRSLSPMRRGSVQSRKSLRRSSLGQNQPPQILADFHALTHFRKEIAKKCGPSKAIFAFSVFLGALTERF
jgi:hypothetical protein